MEGSSSAKSPSSEACGPSPAAKIRTKRSLPASKYSVAQVKGLVANMKTSLAGVKECFPGGVRALGGKRDALCSEDDAPPSCEKSPEAGNEDEDEEDYYPPKSSSLLLAKDSLTLVKIKSRTEKCSSKEGSRKFPKGPPKLSRETGANSKVRESRGRDSVAERKDSFVDPRVQPLEVYSCTPYRKDSSFKSRVIRSVSFADTPEICSSNEFDYEVDTGPDGDEKSVVEEAINYQEKGRDCEQGKDGKPGSKGCASVAKKSASGTKNSVTANRRNRRHGMEAKRSLGVKGLVAHALAGVKESVADVKGSLVLVKGFQTATTNARSHPRCQGTLRGMSLRKQRIDGRHEGSGGK